MASWLTLLLLARPLFATLGFPLTMPYVRPQLPQGESYLCSGVAVDPSSELHITAFTPLASRDTVHHLMVIGCSSPVSGLATNLWNCGGSLGEAGLESPGSTCPGATASQVLFMWSLDAGEFRMPPNVSLAVGGNSTVQHLVLQVHYISNQRIPETGDTSGVMIEYQEEATPLSAGLLSLHVHGTVLDSGFTYWDSACRLLGSVPIQPFAGLGHTHHQGRLVTGWAVTDSMEWVSLSSADPRKPQAFRQVLRNEELEPGRILAARCVLEGSGKQVSQGLSSHHEMCDWFLYFSTPREKFDESAAGQQCTNKGAPGTSWASLGLTGLPSKSYVLPQLTSM